jgi:hypothetical protein
LHRGPVGLVDVVVRMSVTVNNSEPVAFQILASPSLRRQKD